MALGDRKRERISLVRFMPGGARIHHKDTFAGVILGQPVAQLGASAARAADGPYERKRRPRRGGHGTAYSTRMT
ncbi:MAG TPA: hypothetical protein VEY95_16325 [Azospirillaceae bacterium]|nr:hypothetical protein [Azospirillaceae bacterium]